MIRRLLIAVLVFCALPSYAFAVPDKALLKKGVALYGQGIYDKAIETLKGAYAEMPVVGDYSLYYVSKAYLEKGSPEESLQYLEDLFGEYPDTPLKEKADYLGILDNLALGREEEALRLLGRYVEDYPSDSDARFLFAGLLEDKGDLARAKELYRGIYVEAGPLSEEALKKLDAGDLSARDLLDRASSLLKNVRYGEAEETLRRVLKEAGQGDPDGVRQKATKALGQALFSQRKYPEAAGVFLEAGDLYQAARSFFRAGDETGFRETLQKLVSAGDRKAAGLMVAYADAERREGKTQEALKLLEKARSKYPFISEDALWEAGWAYYINGDYDKAIEKFSELHESYRSGKYLYWKARALEKADKEATPLYAELDDADYYGLLALMKTDKASRVKASATGVRDALKPMERPDLLMEAGLEEDAALELLYSAQRTTGYEALLNIAFRLKELGRYRDAMLIASRLPEETRPEEILYPLAYWPVIRETASRYGMDPLLLLSVMREESRFDPLACSRAGAIGLMQLMPATADRTARSLQMKLDAEGDIYEIETNINLGAHYLSGLLKEFGSVSAALAAYNAGDTRVTQWLNDGNYGSYDEFVEDIPFEETRNYVKRILATYFRYRQSRPPDGSPVAVKHSNL